MNTNKNTGLSNKEVLYSRNKYGKNTFTNKKKNTLFKLFIESLNDPIIRILLIALAIKIVLLFNESDIYETLGIAISVFLASFISVISEYSSEKAFEKLSEENSNIKVKVFRNSKNIIIPLEDIVVGDIVILESGDKVPADGILIDGTVMVDESNLTGESEEKIKNIDNNKLYMSSIILENKGKMLVTEVGEKSFYGKIAKDIQELNIESPLKSRLRDLAKFISIIGYIGAVLVFLSYLLNAVIIPNNYSNITSQILYALTLSVAVVVMAVPEGLPMMITLVLSSNMKKLLKNNVLVRKLIGIETSGSLNILFTDKTGTLTEGKLKVEDFVTAEFSEYKKFDNIKLDTKEIIYQSLVYNNESFFDNNKIEGGNITDRAIIQYCNSDNKSKYEILSKTIFNSKLKYSSVTTNYNNKTVFIKGAYEVILNKCNKYLKDDGTVRILLDKGKINKYITNRTKKSQRVLALAYQNSDNSNDFIFIGLIFLKDNIRKEAFKSIQNIKNAGIQVVMVTGDAKETALSVAEDLKIIESPTDIILTSDEFNSMSDEEISNILNNIKVLCRSLPEDKNRLVKIAQANKLITGMTGDGVNDAPALKRSNVGFSMGSGTEVAKETSDIVILDNNISSIVTAILYGRTIFKSIRKFVTFQLSVNLCAVLLSIIGPFIGILSPITVIQVLWVNMVMDTFAGLAFSFEPALNEYLKEKPKNKDEKIINNYMKSQIFVDGIYSMLLCIWFLKSPLIKTIYRYNISSKYLMSAFFGLFIFIDIFNAFNARTHRLNTFSNIVKNKIFLLIFIFISIVQIILIYYGGSLFRTTGLTIYEFEIMILSAFTIIPIDIIRKIIMKKKNIKMGF